MFLPPFKNIVVVQTIFITKFWKNEDLSWRFSRFVEKNRTGWDSVVITERMNISIFDFGAKWTSLY